MCRPSSAGLRLWPGLGGVMGWVVLLLGGIAGCGPAGNDSGPPETAGPLVEERTEDTKSEDREARENAWREKERLDMRAKVDTLARSLARQEAERDRVRYDRSIPPEPEEIMVRSFDGRWGWMILDGGAGNGIREDQVYEVFRGETWVARIRVADVRERISGAWVEELRSGWTPAPGDRAVREQQKR